MWKRRQHHSSTRLVGRFGWLALIVILCSAVGLLFTKFLKLVKSDFPTRVPIMNEHAGSTPRPEAILNGKAKLAATDHQIVLPKVMQDNLSTNLDRYPNIFWPSKDWPPYDRDLYRQFSRLRLEKLREMSPELVRTSPSPDLFEYLPICGIVEAPPEARQQRKLEYFDDLEIVFNFLTFLDLSSAPKTAHQALDENRQQDWMNSAGHSRGMLDRLHDDVFIADAIEGGTRFRDAYLALLQIALEFDRVPIFDKVKNWDDSGPETELGQKMAEILEALKEK